MDCERFDKMSLELLYGELDELAAAATRRHLHHCTRCQGVWNRLRVTRDLSDPPLEDPPADLFESIMAAEREAQRRLPLRERFGRGVSILAGYAMRPQLAMAALLLLMVGSSVLFMRSAPNGRDRIGASELGAPAAEVVAEPERARVASNDELATDEAAMPVGAARAEAAPSAAGPAADATASQSKPEREGYREAMAAYQEGRYAEAERLFSEVAAAGGEKAAAAALHEAHAARNGSGCQRATALYDQVTSRYAGSTVADEAAWQAASCYQALGQIARARAHYQALASTPAYRARAEQAIASLTPAVAAAEPAAEAEAPTDEAKAAASAAPAKAAATTKPAAAAKPASPPAATAGPALE
ncbi:MAG TPA: hypothetical protein VLC09_08670 [Polyangiaceae bacterium]|nr:hypothetical protein [Polyangiaceae bacterium]